MKGTSACTGKTGSVGAPLGGWLFRVQERVFGFCTAVLALFSRLQQRTAIIFCFVFPWILETLDTRSFWSEIKVSLGSVQSNLRVVWDWVAELALDW
jgi:hypothetical protein